MDEVTPISPEGSVGTDVASSEKERPAARQGQILVASIALIAAIGWLLNRGGLPFLPPKGTLDHVDGTYVAGFVFLMWLHLVGRFARCHYLIAPIAHVPLKRLMTINAIGMALITFLPLRIGEMARPAMLREKGRLSAWAVTGTVAAERVLDGVVFSVLLLVGLALATPHEPLPSHIGALPVPAARVPLAGAIASIGFCGAFVVMLVCFRYRALTRRLTERWVGIVSANLGKKIADVVERVLDGLGFLRNPRYTVPYLAVTVLAVVMHVWAIQLLARAVGIDDLSFAESMVVVGVLALGFGMPNAPGFFGAVQFALYAGLAVYVSPETVVHEGAALVFLFYVTFLGLVSLMAAIALVVEYVDRPAVSSATPLADP